MKNIIYITLLLYEKVMNDLEQVISLKLTDKIQIIA